MPTSETAETSHSAKALTLSAYASFLPIGIVTVLLGPMLPTLSTRWSLDYSQSGALFNAQYLASTCAVGISGWMVSRWGYRFAMKAGLLLAAFGVGFLLSGSRVLGIACIACYGAGLGLAVPAANLLVAEVNPGRRSSALNVLNFCWSVGAVSCPFLIAAAGRNQSLPLLLWLVAGFMLAVALGIAFMPSWIVEPAAKNVIAGQKSAIKWRHAALPSLMVLFFVYVGTENGFGGWIASYSKSLQSMTPSVAVMTPSFFYAAIMFGRWLAPFFLRTLDDVRLAQIGLLITCSGMGGLMISRGLPAVVISAAIAGLGISSVYPITIALLSREFGSDASRVGSVLFTLSNLGGGFLPWIVGVSASRFGTLRAGLFVPLIGSITMLIFYFRDWKKEASPLTLSGTG